MKKIVIVYLVWSDEPKKYLPRALGGISQQNYSRDNLHLLVIYNSHRPEEVSQLSFIETELKNHNNLPSYTILSPNSNLGFTGGNNLGMKWAVEHGFDYVFLHNADGYMETSTITELVKAMDSDTLIGQAQSLILLHPERHLINSGGNNLNYNCIGYCSLFRKPLADQTLAPIYDVGYVMAAATLLRVDLIKKHGYLCEDFYLYHEDTEYSLRLKLRGYRTVVASKSIFYHEYEFLKNTKKFFWIERNRHVLKYLIYRWPTILLLFPLELAYNLGLIVIAIKGQWFSHLLNVYKYWLQPSTWRTWKKLRHQYQTERQINDRNLINNLSVTVDTAELVVPLPIKVLVNLVFTFYRFLIKILVWW